MDRRERLSRRERHFKGAYYGQGFTGVASAVLTFFVYTESPVFPIGMIVSGLVMTLCEKFRLATKHQREALLTDEEISQLHKAVMDTQAALNKLMVKKRTAMSDEAYRLCNELHEHLGTVRDSLLAGANIKRAEFKRQLETLQRDLKAAKNAVKKAKRRRP